MAPQCECSWKQDLCKLVLRALTTSPNTELKRVVAYVGSWFQVVHSVTASGLGRTPWPYKRIHYIICIQVSE